MVYDFGPFTFEPAVPSLEREGRPLAITFKAARVLEELIRQRPETVAKERLLDLVWAGKFVEEANLTQAVYRLRKALGEDPAVPRFIATETGVGYRFVAAVQERLVSPAGGGAPDRRRVERPGRRLAVLGSLAAILLVLTAALLARRTSKPRPTGGAIAVLPFSEVGTAVPYLGLAMAEAVSSRLSAAESLRVVPTLTVIARSKGNDPLDIGRRLGASVVVTGSIQRREGTLRVGVQVAQVEDGTIRFAETYDGRSGDLFQLQDQISQRIADAVAAELSPPRDGPRHLPGVEAHEAFMRGRYLLSRRSPESLREAARQFATAVRLDPLFAEALASQAETAAVSASYQVGPQAPRDQYRLAGRAATRSLELAPGLAEAHATLGVVHQELHYDQRAAGRELREAISLAPRSAVGHHRLGWHLLLTGDGAAAREEMRTALALDPASLIVQTAGGMVDYCLGDLNAADERLTGVLEIEPGFLRAHFDLGLVAEARGDFDRADASYRAALALAPEHPLVVGAIGHLAGKRADRATWKWARGELDRLALARYVSPYERAMVALGDGRAQEAIAHLRLAVDERGLFTPSLVCDHRLSGLKEAPELRALMAEVGLGPVWLHGNHSSARH